MCRFLLQWGADPNLSSSYGTTPARAACALVLEHKNPSKEIQLISQLFDIHEYIEQEEFTHVHKIVLRLGLGSLDKHLRCSTDMIDIPDASGRTPIWWAASRGDTDYLQILISHGADVNFPNKRGLTPLHLACENGHAECVDALLTAGADHGARDGAGYTPLAVWAYSSDDDNGEAILSIGRSLIQAGADPNAKDKGLLTPLMFAAHDNRLLAVRFLLENGADPDSPNITGQASLTYAVRSSACEVLRALHRYGAEFVGFDSRWGENILHTAARDAGIEMLVALRLFAKQLSKLDLEAPSRAGAKSATPMDIAAARKEPEGFLDAFKELISFLASYKGEGNETPVVSETLVGDETLVGEVTLVEEAFLMDGVSKHDKGNKNTRPSTRPYTLDPNLCLIAWFSCRVILMWYFKDYFAPTRRPVVQLF
ncbi:Ankyrin-1 [Dactylella cylindrospora]|nr:Ankyrin-1 [Dactylella cylindrospora]